MNADNLSPYSRWQLETYGNILAPNGREFWTPAQDEPDDRVSQREEAFIFSLENPE
jgi:hypothetical protein